MDFDNLNTDSTTPSISNDATRALVVSAASVAGTIIGFAVIAGAITGADKVRQIVKNRKAKKND